MGVFSTQNLLQENFTTTPVIPLSSNNESYFSLALQYSAILNEEFNGANKILYRSLLEAGDNYEIINESFDNFFTKVKDIIAKFIKFLKNLVDKFVTKFNKIIKSDKYIIKNEKVFINFSYDNEFDMQLFNFTHLDNNNIPLANAVAKFNESFELIKDITDKIDPDATDTEKINSIKDKYKEIVDTLEDFYDEFRGTVIGEKPISSSDFASELYEKFRDGDSSTTSTTVTSSLVNMTLLRFKAHDKSVKSVKEIQKKLEKDYNDISTHVEKIVKSKGDITTLIGWDGVPDHNPTNKLSKEIISELDMIAKAQSNKIQVMSTIHLQAMGAKLDAINDCYKQDKTLLYNALRELQKWSNVKESVEETEESFTTPLSISRINDKLETISCYESYMVLENHNQRMMDNYLTECMALESKNSEVLLYISESVGESIKNTITKIINKIREFFAHVVESLDATFKNDKEYLEKYKDIILNKKCNLGEITDFHDYKVKELVESSIPVFNYSSLGDKLDSEEKYRESIPLFKSISVKDEQSFGDAVKAHYSGDSKNIDSEKLNMTDLYNFCYSYEDSKKILNKDLDTLAKAQANAINIADQAANKSKSTNTSKTEKDTSEETPKEESFIYSSVYGQYISESVLLEKVGISKDESNNNTSTTTSNGYKPSANSKATTGMNNLSGTKDDDLSKSISGDDPDTVSKRVSTYFSISQQFLHAKISLFKDIYEDYMFIIREHVRSYGGDKDAKNKDHATKGATVTFKAPDEALKKLNPDQIATYNEKLKEINTEWSKYYRVIKGTEYISTGANLPEKGNPIDKDNREKAIDDALKAFQSDTPYMEYEKYWKETFKDYELPITRFRNEKMVDNDSKAPKKEK